MACGQEVVMEKWDPFILQQASIPAFEQTPVYLSSFETQSFANLAQRASSLEVSVQMAESWCCKTKTLQNEIYERINWYSHFGKFSSDPSYN